MSETEAASPIPVTVVTGFLGSGKTTLLGRLLRDPAFAGTAVIVNELGEVGLDHALLERSDDDVVLLPGGCLCCAVRSDLVATIGSLLVRRAAGTVAPFQRIAIETSGLADPGPILGALLTDPAVAPALALDGVVATVDAVTGLSTLERHPEARRQAALADRLILTKLDLAEADAGPLEARLAALNPGAARFRAVAGDVPATALVGGAGPERLSALVRSIEAASGPGRARPAVHTGEVESFAIVRDAPIRAVALTLLLETLAEHCGPDLLRLKGLVHLAEASDRPMVVHAVQHIVHPPTFLDRWPGEDRRTRLVLIVSGVPRRWVELLLDILDEEAAAADDENGSSP